MSDIVFGRLQDLSPREAWKHEAHAFTPWLAENIDRLSEAVGIPLELTGKEVAVENFSADILARNPDEGSVVLIENQLEATDHTHLGQIMTYLAGLEARTVIWISPRFQEPHLSAIRWLNEYTPEGFAFFAVRLRVVRIADSPYAPIFEVVEQPNDWERRLGATRRQATGGDDVVAARRRAFWRLLVERHPDLAALGVREGTESNLWLKTSVPQTVIGLYLVSRTCGIYIRGPSGIPIEAVAERLEPYAEELESRLGAPLHGSEAATWLLVSKIAYPLSDEEHWPDIVEWMADRLRLYSSTFSDLADRFAA